MMTGFRVAAAQYEPGFQESWEAYVARIGRWVSEAADQGARRLVFPEYFSMELASLFPEHVYTSLARQLEELQALLPEFMALFTGLAQRHGVTIVAGSFPVRQADGGYRNRSHLFRPDGSRDHQDKLQMTRFENERWMVSGGGEARTLDTEFGRIGINVCYDGEFPLFARKQAAAGARLILVPSCTDTMAGYWRVRIGCQARALENQCYVVQSSTVGTVPWSEAIDVNIGAAGVYTPVDYGFPDDGVLCVGELNRPQWLYADLDFDAVARVRETGQVFNFRDWPNQFRDG